MNQKELVSSSKLQSVHNSKIKMQSWRHNDLQTYLHRISGKKSKELSGVRVFSTKAFLHTLVQCATQRTLSRWTIPAKGDQFHQCPVPLPTFSYLYLPHYQPVKTHAQEHKGMLYLVMQRKRILESRQYREFQTFDLGICMDKDVLNFPIFTSLRSQAKRQTTSFGQCTMSTLQMGEERPIKKMKMVYLKPKLWNSHKQQWSPQFSDFNKMQCIWHINAWHDSN